MRAWNHTFGVLSQRSGASNTERAVDIPLVERGPNHTQGVPCRTPISAIASAASATNCDFFPCRSDARKR